MVSEDLERCHGRGVDMTVADHVALSIHLLGRNVMQLLGSPAVIRRQFLGFSLSVQAIVKRAGQYITWPNSDELPVEAGHSRERPAHVRFCEDFFVVDIIIFSGYDAFEVAVGARAIIFAAGADTLSADLARVATLMDRKAGGCEARVEKRVLPGQRMSENEEDFVCRRGYHSINAGIVVDFEGKTRWISAQWPGYAHDSRVFKLYAQLKAKELEGAIIGDSAYGSEEFCLSR
ncbi:unnamed protein product [Heligmosomoides polygyrus]|uniref:DDE Tnp4 domain-containing protein n=1 Tax=Heligmosomoides polygyrus TaxID=6339 RepID=A0A183GK50_HELPZ|nr:unnamed protein product [Heligmosomoides polygyrus]